MLRQIRILAAAAALLMASAGGAAAQFTSVVTPPPPSPRHPATVARADSASRVTGARDSANTTRLTDMKTWVDSATVALAGSDALPRGDTLSADTAGTTTAATSTAAGRRDGARRPEPTMRDGARAPDTATPLPAVALVGVLALGAGLVLIGRDRRRA